MSAESWKTPLEEIADPFRLKKWAENASAAELPLDLWGEVNACSFVDAFTELMKALSAIENFGAKEDAGMISGRGQAAFLDKAASVAVLNEASNSFKRRNTLVNIQSKKEAWGKCIQHIGAWSSAFSSDIEHLQAAVSVDYVLWGDKGPISIDEAVERVRREYGGLPQDIGEIVQWYLQTIRVKYRKNIKLKVAQVECPKCHGRHDDGAECPYCRKAEKSLEAAKKALAAKRWQDAQDKANEALSVWKDNAEGEEIRRKAEAGIEEERRRIEEAEEAERKRKERERRELQQRIDALKADFDVACKSADWRKAEAVRKQIVGLGDRSADWDIEINRRKESYKSNRQQDCKRALAEFVDALSQNNIPLAEAKFAEAKEAEKALREKCGIRAWMTQISDAGKALEKMRRESLVDNLRPVQSLKVKGSTSGQPTIEVSWQPGVGGTPVAKWRIIRREKGTGVGGKNLPELDGAKDSFIDRGSDLRLGVEYIYEVTPQVKTDKGFKTNEKAAVQSDPAICLAKLPADALNESSGEGEAGVWGVVTLRWTLPAGIDHRSGVARLSLSRKDGKIRDMDVTELGGKFEDANVEVGQTQEYSLSLFLGGQDAGTAVVRVVVRPMRQPEPVRELHAPRNPNGRWLVEWIWPEGMGDAIVGPVVGEVTDGARLEAMPGARPITQEIYAADRGVEMYIDYGVNAVAVCTFKDRHGGGRIYSRVEVVPVIARQAQVSYGFIQKSGGLFFRKTSPAVAVVWSDAAALPDLVMVEGRSGRPSQKDAGAVVAQIPARLSCAPVVVNLPESVKPERTKLFLANPERDADLFRIALPVAVPKNVVKQL